MSTFENNEVAPSHQPPIAELRKEERRWFSWLSVLHEQVSKSDSANAAVVLDVAKKRWLKAREALSQQGFDAQGASD
jgi:membrane-anchored protein YejM (alkaline phosphatase superfamily)